MLTEPKPTSQTRVLRVLKALKGHSLTGLSNREIADAIHDSASNVSRALTILMGEGLAAKLDNGRYAHGLAMLQIAHAHQEHSETLQRRAVELDHRVVAGSL